MLWLAIVAGFDGHMVRFAVIIARIGELKHQLVLIGHHVSVLIGYDVVCPIFFQ